MSFLYPAFLLGALAIAIPVLLHLFRRRTETVVEFPAVRLLQKTPVEQQRRRRLRELILLALRVTALALLALAFARPYFTSATTGVAPPVTVIALDTSFSLSAPGQFARAQEAARAAVQEAPPTHHVALVTFGDAATVVVPPTTDRGGVLAAVDQMQPTAAGTRFRTALGRAAEAISSGGAIVVVSDLQQAGWDTADEGAVPEGVTVTVREVPPPATNLAVTAVRRESDRVIAAVHNFGPARARVPVTLLVDGTAVATETLTVAPGTAVDVRFAPAVPSQGGAEVRIEDAAGYAGDNARYLVLDPPPAIPVHVITADPPASSTSGLYVERALGVAGSGQMFDVRVIDGRDLPSIQDGDLAQSGLIVLLGTRSLDRDSRARVARYLSSGGRVLLALGPDTDLATLKDTTGIDVAAGEPPIAPAAAVRLVAADVRHPIFRPFLDPSGALGSIAVERFVRIAEASGGSVLARFSGAGAALVEQPVGQGRLIVFASDLDNRWNRFPLSPSFVPWVIETARYLTQGRVQPQSYTLPEAPAAAAGTAGIHDAGGRRIAVNVDVRESNPARGSAEEFVAAITRSPGLANRPLEAAARAQEERQRLWQLGLLLMFLALASEGLIGRKAT